MLDLLNIINGYTQIVYFAFFAYILPKGIIGKNIPTFRFNIKKLTFIVHYHD